MSMDRDEIQVLKIIAAVLIVASMFVLIIYLL